MPDIVVQRASRTERESHLPRLSPGETLPSGHVIDCVIAEGGMGIVYKAHKPNPITPLYKAIKIISPDSEVLQEEHGREELERTLEGEAEATGTIGSSPYVVGIEDFGELADGSKYLIFPFIKGFSLTHIIQEHIGRGYLIPFELSAFIFHRIVCVLSTAHKHPVRPITHRDLCPNNIMIQEDTGVPLVLDWGSASEVCDDYIIGKPPYVAPEVVKKDKPDPNWGIKADIFSLATIIREMMIGQNCLEAFGESFDDRKEVDTDTIVPLHMLCEDVPKGLSRIIRICMSEDPAGRPDAETLYDYIGHRYLYTTEIGFGVTHETVTSYLQFFFGEYDPETSLPDNQFGRNLAKLVSSKVRRRGESAEYSGRPMAELAAEIGSEYTYRNVPRTFADAFGGRRVRHAMEKPFVAYLNKAYKDRIDEEPARESELMEQYDREFQKLKDASDAKLMRDLKKGLDQQIDDDDVDLDEEANHALYDLIMEDIDQFEGPED